MNQAGEECNGDIRQPLKAAHHFENLEIFTCFKKGGRQKAQIKSWRKKQFRLP